MAAFSTLAVTNVAPTGVTLTFNAAAVDLTAYQVQQLAQVVNKCLTNCNASEGQSASSAAITLPANF